jgi:hypothetical protein
MHLTLKPETTRPTSKHFRQQQAEFEDFIDCYNDEVSISDSRRRFV